MKFNEKLIELRKKEGLSQEELAYKLNVTRQTISKWELGQTTPEMDKLSEISSFFGVSADTLLNETQESKIEDKKISNNEQNNKKIVLIIIGILLVLALIGALIWGPIIMLFKNIFDTAIVTPEEAVQSIENVVSAVEKSEMYNNAVQQIEQAKEDQLDQLEQNKKEQEENSEEFKQKAEEMINGVERAQLTSVLELYSGTNYGGTVKTVIDKIVTNNKKNIDEIIIVKYQGQSITDSKELQKLKTNFDGVTEYEISYEYDENGYIYQMDILNLN